MTRKNNNIILGIDTSCYTTSIAAITLDKKIILNEKIILKVKKDCKGLRQSEAVFQHVNNMGEISKVIKSLEELIEYTINSEYQRKTKNLDLELNRIISKFNTIKRATKLI